MSDESIYFGIRIPLVHRQAIGISILLHTTFNFQKIRRMCGAFLWSLYGTQFGPGADPAIALCAIFSTLIHLRGQVSSWCTGGLSSGMSGGKVISCWYQLSSVQAFFRCSRAAFDSESLPLFFVNRLFRNLKGSLWKHNLVCSLLLCFLNRFSVLFGVSSLHWISSCNRFMPFFSSEAFLHCFFSCLLSLMRQSISVCHLELQGLGHLTDGLCPWIFFSALRC